LEIEFGMAVGGWPHNISPLVRVILLVNDSS